MSRFNRYLQDSVKISNRKFINNLFLQARSNIIRNKDTGTVDIFINGKSEDPYLPYEGRIIRHIQIEALGFDRTFTDTATRYQTVANRIGNSLHTNTRAFVVRNSLFIKENTPVNAFKIADNERYLRSLDYIHDARILVKNIPDNPDSVDILVVTKDFFTISADGAANGLDRINAHILDANIAGMGQSVLVTGLYDHTRSPNSVYGAAYRKNNIGNSFVNATVGYSLMDVNNYTHVEETTEYVGLDRPLVSPYSRFAGGFIVSNNIGYNSYHVPDSLAFVYKYSLIDGWVGYNLGIKKLTATNNTIRDRRFLAVRYFNYNFTQVPTRIGDRYDPVFNSKMGVLSTITFFKQDYFKTQYIYGFGTTEDLPYGYNISVTGGWIKQLNLERPYAGINAQRYIATEHGDFLQFFVRTGGYYFHNHVQDLSFMVGGTAYSRIIFLKQTKIRQYILFNYSSIYRQITSAPLRIDNAYGIREFLSDSAYGSRRITLQLETPFYLRYKVLGFQFAPFPYADFSLLQPIGRPFNKVSLYSGVGGGVRARNENLVFGTIELRAFYYPVTPDGVKGFKIILNSEIRYRYNSNFITEPDYVQLNLEQN
jgi:hypothetical protein